MKILKEKIRVILPFLLLFTGLSFQTILSQELDNKTFIVSMYDVNNPEEIIEDNLNFKDGKFDSKECKIYGFKPVEYTTSNVKGTIYFTAKSLSETEGKMIWDGTVINKIIEGTCVWKKPGQKDISYKYYGKLKMEKMY